MKQTLIVLFTFTSVLFVTASTLSAAGPKGKAEILFYEGLLAYHRKDCRTAERKFRETLRLDPSFETADQLLRICLAQGKKRPAAASKRWFLNAALTINYDSNVSLNPESLSLASLPSQRNDVGFIPQIGGGYHLIDREHYRLTALGSYSQSVYPTLSHFNYGLLHTEVSNQFHWGKISLRAPVAYEFALLGSSAFFSSFVSRPAASYLWADRFLTQLTPQVRLNNFSQTLLTKAQDRDAWNFNPALDQYWMVFDPRHFVKIGYAYEQNWAEGNDWDYHAHDVNGELLLPLPRQFDLDLTADFLLDKHFDNVDSVVGARRNDSGQSYRAAVSRRFFDRLTASVSYTFTRNASSLALFTYHRHIGGITLATDF